MMKELVEHMAKSLVTQPEAIEVVEQILDDRTVNLELHTAKDDMGKVIGKQGKIAKAIRSVVKAASSKDDIRVDVEIV